jgi:hypothetical protein
MRFVRNAIVPAALGVATFALCYGLALAFSRAGVFLYLDVLFDTDAAWFLQGFSEGRGTGTGWGARSLVHPNAANLVNPPLRLVAEACASIGACESAATLRPNLALLVSPLAAACEVVFVFLAIRTVTGSEFRALLVALLNLVLLPTLIFGAVPESFAVTGCAFGAMFYLASRSAIGQPVRTTWWLAVAIVLGSFTATNVWLFAVGYAVVQSRERWLTVKASVGALRLAVIAAACTSALALAIGWSYGALSDYRTAVEQFADFRAPREDLAERRWPHAIREGVSLAASGALSIFPKALGHTVLPQPASIQGTTDGLKLSSESGADRPEPTIHANYRYASADWGTFLTLAALAGAFVAGIRSRGPQRLVYRVGIALIAANWAFHSLFGVEMFLYAKHWSVAVAIVLGAWFEVRRPVAYAGVAAVVVLVALAAARDVGVFTHLLRALYGS